MKENTKEIPNVMRWCDENDIPSCSDIFIFSSSDYSKSNLEHRTSKDDLAEFFIESMKDKGKLSYIWGVSKEKRDLSQIDFYGGATDNLCVSGDGSIYPMIGWYEKLGDIKTNTLKEVFENNALLKKIRTIRASDIAECKACDCSDFCDFCCSTHICANDGELYKVDKDYCEFVRIRKEYAAQRDSILNENFDFHVHIGQFKDIYYKAADVFSALKANNSTGCLFASTSACKELQLDAPKEAVELYDDVTKEMQQALSVAKTIQYKAVPLYWVVPLILKAGITLEQAFSDVDYKGLVIHPWSHNWNPADAERASLLDQVFTFARERKLPIFIHTGMSESDEPIRFEKWFKTYPDVEVHLAHCKHLEQVLNLFSKYKNLYGDTAFCPNENIQAINDAGFSNRMLFGTDFPVTYWFDTRNDDTGEGTPYSVQELIVHYKNVLAKVQL